MKEKRETGHPERKRTRTGTTVSRFTQNAAFGDGILLGPIFFLVTIPAQLLLALVLIHLLLALFTCPRHVSLRSSSASRKERGAFA